MGRLIEKYSRDTFDGGVSRLRRELLSDAFISYDRWLYELALDLGLNDPHIIEGAFVNRYGLVALRHRDEIYGGM